MSKPIPRAIGRGQAQLDQQKWVVRRKPAIKGMTWGRIGGLWRLVVDMRPQSATVGRKLAVLAANSHGVVTGDELLAAGITQAQIRTRLANGGLIPVHRGVFRVGHAAPRGSLPGGGQGMRPGLTAERSRGGAPPPPPEPPPFVARSSDLTSPTSHRSHRDPVPDN